MNHVSHYIALFALAGFFACIQCTPAQRMAVEGAVIEEARILCAVKQCELGVIEAVVIANACAIAEAEAKNVINTRAAVLRADAGAP